MINWLKTKLGTLFGKKNITVRPLVIDASSNKPETAHYKRESNIYGTLQTLDIGRERLRAAYFNNELVRGAVHTVSSSVVSESGIRGMFVRGNQAVPREGLTKLNDLWDDFASSLVDTELSTNMLGLQTQVINSMMLDGSVYVQLVFDEERPYIRYFSAESLAICLNKDLDNGRKIRLGVEYDELRIKNAYYIRKNNKEESPVY